MVTRREDWPERLIAYVESRESTPFNWGYQDCCTFAAGAVEAISGVDLMADLRGYRTAEQAGRILSQDLVCMVDARLPRIDRGEAQRGDVALVTNGKRQALAIFLDSEIVGAGVEGLERFPRSVAAMAWRV